ncbi:extracellular endoglucanase precursor [Labilithrix luteola]|uniref:Extracellular endoglucanase n=1 Tax=Labilithrix luteola TaxID=1391654 RepID=A0A0K1QEM4_9BACT|nr:expansin EXLX1 family cellulose-binding protein [Labilithrix luteola]AKV04122.1 extracellular endoglucanase precursor [Labilithrix luteola]
MRVASSRLSLLAALSLAASLVVFQGCGGDENTLESGAPSPDGAETSETQETEQDTPDAGKTSKDAGDASSKPDGSTSTKDADTDSAPPATTYSGQATYYDANGTGACGFPASTDYYVVAMNKAQYSKSICGQCIHVKGPNGEVTVRIVDLCPGCSSGDLDLSMTAFKKIAPLSAGRVNVSWSFVPCP